MLQGCAAELLLQAYWRAGASLLHQKHASTQAVGNQIVGGPQQHLGRLQPISEPN
jgi:hypothetical protein